METAGVVYISIVIIVLVMLAGCIRVMFKGKKKKTRSPNSNNQVSPSSSHHQDDIYSISGRVQGEEQQHSSQDAYLSIDHINISNQLNKPNYDDAPPSYEEAMRIAVAASLSSSSSEVPTVVVVPKTTN